MSIEVKIGVIQHPHEIDLEVDGTADELIAKIEEAVNSDKPMVWFTDVKGNRSGVIAEKIAFLEIKNVDDVKRVGFGV